ncbi:carbohydrate ABC transporter permease [Kribbella shirazensis]|uniref:ABC-type glycerol-3-phosphate transport system permease component n=1 Tax=Kribbella shirazensis TaxID=1105143 RepID=A0A7X5VKY0_9ACTN|nr:carbohydrate ABC transporter permease [Kribbella shirazensis]NIK61988.1 ABC-type glycerol-3-phosphate transport system permease component [Kribbella shirazensis]
MTVTTSDLRADVDAPAKLLRRRRLRSWTGDAVVLGAVAVVLAAMVFPFAWMVLTSFRPADDMFDLNRILPDRLTLNGFRSLFASSDFGRYVLNSAIVALVAMVLSVVISCLTGYAFSRFEFRGKRFFMVLVIAVHLFPFVILITPLYLFFSEVHLLNTYQGLVIAYVALTLPFATYLMMGYFDTVPKGLDEAARIDGCSTLGVLFRVVFPIAWPGVATVAINTFVMAWEEYLFAKVLMTDNELKTVQVGLGDFFGEFTTQWDLVMCASVVASVPTIVLFAVAQRRLVSGLATGSVKE